VAVKVGIVSAGAMGSAIGQTLLDGGAEVVTTVAGRSDRTARLARKAGLDCLPDLETVVRESDVVLSVAPPDRAVAIAAAIGGAARGSAAPLVADLNATSPATARRVEAELATFGLELVDGSISGPPPRKSETTRIYLSGPRWAEVAALPFAGVDLIRVGGNVGTASAVKMCTASVYKGAVAVLTQALLTARANDVLEHVVDDLGELARGASARIASGAAKSGRYVGEMHEIAATQAGAGLTPALFEAMASVYAALAEQPLARQAPEEVDVAVPLEEVLAALEPLGRLTSPGVPPTRGQA
jgi:3-hydroxyisobutyrate dehydrogenase-like beta-hydroxyacid dehydrogenase